MTIFSLIKGSIALLAAMTVLVSDAAEPASDKKLPGTGVKAHHVQLTGHYGDNEDLRARLIESIRSCADINRNAGQPHHPLQLDKIPPLAHPVESELYIAENRILLITRLTINSYDPITCALKPAPYHRARIASTKGICDINLTKKTAFGACNDAAHATAPPLAELMAKHESASPAIKARYPLKTGEKKTIAGFQCEVYKSKTSVTEQRFCIVNAGSFVASPLLSFDGMVPGLQLEMTSSRGDSLVATKVQLDAEVNAEIFTVPKDVNVKPTPRVR